MIFSRVQQPVAAPTDPSRWPKITVITPSFNQNRFLGQCIQSVLEQDYPKLQYIIVDGGSDDGSVQTIRSFTDRLSHWISEPDEGQSHAINKGFAMAQGDLFAWLNADDYYLSGALAKVADAWCANPGGSFYFGDGLRVNEAGERTRGFFPRGRVLFSRQSLVLGLNYILQPATFIRTETLRKVGPLDTTLHWGMDSDLWLRLSCAAEPVAIQAQLAASREHAETKTATGSFERIEELRRIAARHSGVPMTPGTLCYLLDTLHRTARENPEVYPTWYVRQIESFWQSTSGLMSRFGTTADGFPMRSDKKEP